ncbi:MAG TPA: sigma-70 family RNA polymerase sigma factor [Terriglobales bacterium]|nr:sigma-70 family RNA polymerase sigma factor [Terriglobales bacterium]
MTSALRPPAEKIVEGISLENFDQVIRQHQRRVYGVILLLARDADVADTLTQECFLRAFRKRHSFRGECSVRTWLLRIATNLARDHQKSRRVAFWKRLVGLDNAEESIPMQVAAPEASPERTLMAREELRAVWDAVETLPQQQRTIFLLRFAQELTLEEVACLLDLQVGTVKAHLFRATGRVREMMKEQQWR